MIYKLMRIDRQFDLLVAEIMTILEELSDLFQTTSRRGKEPQEGLAGREHSAEILRVELHTHKPLVVLQLKDLHALARFIFPNECQTGLFQVRDEFRIHFVTVTVSLPDLGLVAIQLAKTRPFRARLEFGDSLTETHRTTQLGLVDFRHVDNGWLFAMLLKLGAAGFGHPAHIASVLDDGQLHTQADTKVRHVICASPVSRFDHALGAALAKTTLRKELAPEFSRQQSGTYWDEDAVSGGQVVPC